MRHRSGYYMTIDLHHKKMEKSGIPDFFPEKNWHTGWEHYNLFFFIIHNSNPNHFVSAPLSFYKSYHKINQKSSCINKFQHGIIFKKKRTSFRQFRPYMDKTRKYIETTLLSKQILTRIWRQINLCWQTKSAYITPLHLHGRMHITVQSNAGVRVPQQFTECLWIETVCNTNRGIGMSKQMKRYIPQLTSFQNRLKAILHRSRFFRLCRARKQKQLAIFFLLW